MSKYMSLNHQKAWVVAVDMGYGHQRAAAPLKNLAYGGEVINANNYKGIPKEDQELWHDSRRFYEFISRFKNVPILGRAAFDLFDKFQEIPPFYPKRDLSDPNLQVKYMHHLIQKKDWGKHLIQKLDKKPMPLITTFFVTAFMAEQFNYSADIYAVATDTDISRSWVPIDPEKSRIRYFAPSQRAYDRLKRYGVQEDKIFLTGFPLPIELLGQKSLNILKGDLGHRLTNLDPNRKYIEHYGESLVEHLGKNNFPGKKRHHPLTIMFAVGGAGAQREVGVAVVKSLRAKIRRGQVRVILVAGTHKDIKTYFKREIISLGLDKQLGRGVIIIHCLNKEQYFRKFNRALRTTDILWTKPSELSFYTALGLPIVMAPPIGSQEKFNRKWLFMIGSGVEQERAEYTDEWLFDLINTGWFAEAAVNGFLEAPKYGTYNIQKIISAKPEECLRCKTEMRY